MKMVSRFSVALHSVRIDTTAKRNNSQIQHKNFRTFQDKIDAGVKGEEIWRRDKCDVHTYRKRY